MRRSDVVQCKREFDWSHTKCCIDVAFAAAIAPKSSTASLESGEWKSLPPSHLSVKSVVTFLLSVESGAEVMYEMSDP